MRTVLAGFVCSVLMVANAWAFGPAGHELVGAIADEKIAGTPAAKAVRDLLGQVTLARAATLPDELKGWDRFEPNDPHGIGGLLSKPLTDKLWQFWTANPPPEKANEETPSHHWFHYTDVPVEQSSYDEGKRGRSKWDIVQMIPFCVRVLKGEEPEDNARKITKPVALVLLTHYVGDLHQPLHVGGQFFKPDGTPVDGEDPSSLENQGGNTIILHLAGATTGATKPKLHSFWDSQAAAAAVDQIFKEIEQDIEKNGARHFPPFTHAQLAHWLAAREPAGWSADPSAGADAMLWTMNRVKEMLPLAREAHRRVQFRNVVPGFSHGHPVANGEAHEIPAADGKTYLDWASDILALRLQVAGWRLAEILQSIWKPPAAERN